MHLTTRGLARRPAAAVAMALWLAALAGAADWPTWRHDPGRSAVTEEDLPDELELLWVRHFPRLKPAWPDEPRMRFDEAYRPIVSGEMLFVASSYRDDVTAIDIRTGAKLWSYYTDGPVRFAPVAWRDRLYFVCDDGQLYCLDAATGRLRWKVRGGPSDRKLIGNERLISMWPARGGCVLVEEGSARRGATVYFAAGIWPFMGVFIRAVDAGSGEPVWCNDTGGAIYLSQPHDSPAFAGVAPQGYLLAAGDKLLVPNGRAVPAALDRATGRLLYFHHARNKKNGDSRVLAFGEQFISSGNLFDLKTGKAVAKVPSEGVADPPVLYQSVETPLGQVIAARDPATTVTAVYADERGGLRRQRRIRHLWELPTEARPMLRAGGRLYAAGSDAETGAAEILAIDLPPLPLLDVPPPQVVVSRKRQELVDDPPAPLEAPGIAWRKGLRGTPATMLAAAGRLFVVTKEGAILCYGEKPPEEPVETETLRPPPPPEPPPWEIDPDMTTLAAEILTATGAAEGYCVVAGIEQGQLAERLARQSRLHVVVVDPSREKIAELRYQLRRGGLYGPRVAAFAAEPRSVELPQYMAELIVSERPAALLGGLAGLFDTLRPYGGTLCLALPERLRKQVAAEVAAAKLPGAEVRQVGPLTLLRRRGPLPGAGAWTGQYGDAANTCVSPDERVRPPLGVLWFGGPSSEDVLPRHGHGPPEQVVGGRLYIEGPDMLRALDVYTGRRLWEKYLPGVGSFYNYKTHEPGADAVGTNFLATPEAVYVAYGDRCLVLGPATGHTHREFVLPHGDQGTVLHWGYLSAWEDLLIGAATPMRFATPEVEHAELMRARWDSKQQQIVMTYSERTVGPLLEIIRGLRGFTPVKPTASMLPPTTQPWGRPTPRPTNEVDFVVANLNKLLGDPAMVSKLPPDVVAQAREASTTARLRAEAGAQYAAQRAADLGLPKPPPPHLPKTVAMIQAETREHLALPGTGGPDDRHLRTLNRELLDWCYRALPRKRPLPVGRHTHEHTASSEIVVLDRLTGRPHWRRRAKGCFGHNAIAVGAGKLFCIDHLPSVARRRLLHRGVHPEPGTLLALDARTGKGLWQTSDNVFGTWLGYSAEHDVLLQAARPSRDMLRDEPGGRLIAYRGRTGQVLWEKRIVYGGPCLLRGRTVIAQGHPREKSRPRGFALDLLTGEPIAVEHPLTGERIPWTYGRHYGCGTPIGSRHLLTFRSAAAGFYDLTGGGGTGNLGGFRSGCTSNLVAADGVLNAPDYTNTCTCSYQNRTSLALVHMPRADLWTFQAFTRGYGPIRRLGLNFGAPGDRKADDGTLWLEYPVAGGPSPAVTVVVDGAEVPASAPAAEVAGDEWQDEKHEDKPEPATSQALDEADEKEDRWGIRPEREAGETRPRYFRRHPSGMAGGGIAWVAASGVEGAGVIEVSLGARARPKPRDPPELWTLGDIEAAVAADGPQVDPYAPAGRYTVVLHFAEHRRVKPGDRVFSVAIQGRQVLKDFDVMAAAGKRFVPAIRTFKGIDVDSRLQITFTPAPKARLPRSILCGLAVIREE